MMSKKIILLVVSWIVFAIWIIIITFLSSQNGTNTSKTSIKLISFLGKYIPFVRRHELMYNNILRKMAHVFLFTFLCGFLYLALFMTLNSSKQAYIGAVSFSVFFALFDEAKKLFVPGRHLHWLDVEMNIVGVVFGIFIMYFLGSWFSHYIKD